MAAQGSEENNQTTRNDYLISLLSQLHAIFWLTDSILRLFNDRKYIQKEEWACGVVKFKFYKINWITQV